MDQLIHVQSLHTVDPKKISERLWQCKEYLEQTLNRFEVSINVFIVIDAPYQLGLGLYHDWYTVRHPRDKAIPGEQVIISKLRHVLTILQQAGLSLKPER